VMRHPEVAADDRRSAKASQQTQADLCAQHPPENLRLGDLTKPQQVQEKPRQATRRPDEDDEDPHHHQRPPAGWTVSHSHLDLFTAGHRPSGRQLPQRPCGYVSTATAVASGRGRRTVAPSVIPDRAGPDPAGPGRHVAVVPSGMTVAAQHPDLQALAASPCGARGRAARPAS
jgi:hypothetical protein